MEAAIQAVIFDVFGTLVDWRSGVAREAGEFFARKAINLDPHRFADAWRAQYQPAMQQVRAGERGYVALDDLHLENLERVLDACEIADRFSRDEKQALNRAWEKLPAWPDVAPGLAILKRHYLIAPCSNGSIALMARLAKFARLPWDAIVGADIARAYKPGPQAYLRSVAALRLTPRSVLMVAAHNDDLAAARACGLKTAFVPRPTEHGPDQKSDLTASHGWDFVAPDVKNLADILTI